GSFTAGNTYSLASTGSAIIVGDFTNDGKLDLAVLENNGTVAVLPGNGDGTFGTASTTTVGGGNTSGTGPMAAGDFYGTGQLDAAVWVSWSAAAITIVPGSSTGSWGQPIIYASAQLPSGGPINETVAADVNGDGRPDLVYTDGSSVYALVTNPLVNQ